MSGSRIRAYNEARETQGSKVVWMFAFATRIKFYRRMFISLQIQADEYEINLLMSTNLMCSSPK